MNKPRGNKSRELRNEPYFETSDNRKGIRMPPIGMATLMVPRTVPAIFLNSKPARVNVKGKMADIDNPARKTAPEVNAPKSKKYKPLNIIIENPKSARIRFVICLFGVKKPIKSRPEAIPTKKVIKPILELI